MLRDDQRGRDMTGLTLSSEINSIFPMGTSVQTRREAQVVAHYSRGRSGESGAGFQPAG
jgi:hypothetical protein